jgi:hypothetical protein
MPGTYNYITLGQLRAALMQRLQDVNNVGTPVAEANVYITESLRVLNAQTWIWNADYELDFNPGDAWKSLNVAGSPRRQTVTDSYLYSQMEAMLMEPMSGGIWTGTNQFNITMLSQALQYRRDELLLLCTANVLNQFLPSPVLSMRTLLPDSTMEVLRVRWIPADSGAFSPYALGRGDVNSRNAYGALLTIQPGEPDSWLITANTPLSFDCSCPPNQPGQWDMLMQFSGLTLVPPATTSIGIPDDWTPALIYGALADVLSNAPEGRDSARAKYCLSRYEQFKKAIVKMPWLVQASIEGIPCDTPSFVKMDAWAQNWEQTWDPTDPQIVVGGIDLVALAPFATSTAVSSVLTLIGNAPIPANDAAEVQLDRSGVDAVLNYAQHLAMFKYGGADFAATFPLLSLFEEYCRVRNRQYAALGIYRPEMLLEGNKAELLDPRFEKENESGKAR